MSSRRKLGFETKVPEAGVNYPLVLGSSFREDSEDPGSLSFATLRYKFKPSSLDQSSDSGSATLRVQSDSRKALVSFGDCHMIGSAVTDSRSLRKDHLVWFDYNSGQMVLERVSFLAKGLTPNRKQSKTTSSKSKVHALNANTGASAKRSTDHTTHARGSVSVERSQKSKRRQSKKSKSKSVEDCGDSAEQLSAKGRMGVCHELEGATVSGKDKSGSSQKDKRTAVISEKKRSKPKKRIQSEMQSSDSRHGDANAHSTSATTVRVDEYSDIGIAKKRIKVENDNGAKREEFADTFAMDASSNCEARAHRKATNGRETADSEDEKEEEADISASLLPLPIGMTDDESDDGVWSD